MAGKDGGGGEFGDWPVLVERLQVLGPAEPVVEPLGLMWCQPGAKPGSRPAACPVASTGSCCRGPGGAGGRCPAECELPLVVAEVPGGVAVDVGEGHVVGEERVPGGGVVHATAQRGFGFLLQALDEGGDHVVEHPGHAPGRDDPGAHAGAQVVDQVEWPVRGVQDPGEGFAGPVGEQAEDAHEDQQSADDQVAEQHVEQQLLVGPPGPLRRPAQIRGSRVAGKPVEVGSGLVDLGPHCSPVQGSGMRVRCCSHGGFLAGDRSGSRRDGGCHRDQRGGLGGCAGR